MSVPSIVFPDDPGEKIKYYCVHYAYLLNIFKVLNFSIELKDMPAFDSVGFKIYINGQEVIIDFSDHLKILPGYDVESDIPYFKYHYCMDRHEAYKNVYPLSPVSFHNWIVYRSMLPKIKYVATGKILNNQRPGGNATERRVKVQKILVDTFGEQVDLHFYPNQPVFWKLINECLVSVCIPGARNDILDRGQIQYMAFGCCTISPEIKCVLPWHKKLESNVHFVECNPDYSDIVEKIEWCKENRLICIQIGQNAKRLFDKTSLPIRIWEWMRLFMEK